ncbi:MAG: DUF3455 domain-containing protein [Dehalococcoidia bacterium]
MNTFRSSRWALLFAAVAVAYGALMALAGAGRSHAAQGGVPANLVPPDGQVLQRELLGIGAQVYTCRASATAGSGFEWAFTAPAAVLLDDSGAIAGTHFAGPTWQANDGSSVTAEVVERAPSAEPSAIPWLLLRVTAAGAPGSFGGVAYIQRLETTGGVAPTVGCDEEHAGVVARVPYSAVYAVYGAP